MTYPIKTTGALANALALVPQDIPLLVRLRDATEWQLDGVAPLLDDKGETVAFVLVLEPNENHG